MKVIHRSATALLVLVACAKPPAPAPVYQTVAVSRRDIVVSAEAAGAISPDTIVEVKSKASGEVLDIKVETGQLVQRGTLLVSIDRRVPTNDVAQAQATLDVAQARLDNAQAQLNRSNELFAAKVITQQEFQTAQLDVANAKAAKISAQIALDNTKIAMNDTDVLSPITGTVIKKTVERGAVISSPTRDVGGGTVLLTMADLSLVQVRTFVDETDIGKLHPGLDATVMVQAYPNRPFVGTVLKIEPQADTIQNVVMFPVLVRIDNRDGLLLPGMSATVKIAVGSRDSVLAVPNAALRTEKDAPSAANVLGIADTNFKTMLAAAKVTFDNSQAAARDTTKGAAIPAAGSGAPGAGAAAPANSASVATTGGGRGAGGGGRGGRGGRVGGGQGTGNGERGTGSSTAGGAGGAPGGGGGGRGRGGRGGRGGGGGGKPDNMAGGKYIVFAIRAGHPTPVYIQTGLTDLDYSEVKRGLVEGDSVLMLPSASMIQAQQCALQRSQRQTAGLPGQGATQSGAPINCPQPGGGGGGAGGGAARGGGG